MGYVSVKEIWSGRSAHANDKGESDYVRVWRVVTDSSLVGALSARTAPGLPGRYDPYVAPDGTVDLGSLVREIEAAQEQNNPWTWLVTVRYSSKFDQPPESGAEDPLLRPPELSVSAVKYTLPLTADTDGKAVLNSAGDYFDPPVEAESERVTFTFRRYESVPPLPVTRAYSGRISSAPFQGFDTGTVKCTVGAERSFERGALYWKYTYAFEYTNAPGGWDGRVVDRGYRKKAGADKVNITDKYGKQLSAPALLDGAGGELADPTPATAKYLTFKRYYRADFNALGLV